MLKQPQVGIATSVMLPHSSAVKEYVTYVSFTYSWIALLCGNSSEGCYLYVRLLVDQLAKLQEQQHTSTLQAYNLIGLAQTTALGLILSGAWHAVRSSLQGMRCMMRTVYFW